MDEMLVRYGTLIPSVLAAVTFHEYAHARTALALGDPTAKELGRVTLNPLAHLDPIGTLMLFLVGFGWGKPVPVTRSRLHHPRYDLFVSLAGPATNLVLAFLSAQLLKAAPVWEALGPSLAPGGQLLGLVFFQINLVLGIFNLLPLFPLDGSHVVENLLPAGMDRSFSRVNRSYGPILLMIMVAAGYVLPVSPLAAVLSPGVQFFSKLFLGASGS
jgi:Zn-dependent protease